MSDLSSNTHTDAAAPPRKRSCGSSEETTLTPSHSGSGQSSVVAAPPQAPHPPAYSPAAAQAIIESARRYENEALRRNDEARVRLTTAEEDVELAADAARKARDRLRDAERCFAITTQTVKRARDYVSQWEEKFPEAAAKVQMLPVENDAADKHVSFAPQHVLNVPSSAASAGSLSASLSGTRKVRRKRIRVTEHGWGTYEGHLDSHGEPSGRGTVTWENGSKYSGDWVEGRAHGHGVMDYSNGDKYEGDWRDGSRYGHGTHHFKDGGVYCGQWRNAAPDGQGKMTLGNGSHYVGKWKDGKWHGHGIVRPVNGGEWEGMFENGKCTVGTLRRPNGEIEIGRYDSVNPDDVKEGVWWSTDRREVWMVANGTKVEEITPEGAGEVAARLGIDLPKDLGVGYVEGSAMDT